MNSYPDQRPTSTHNCLPSLVGARTVSSAPSLAIWFVVVLFFVKALVLALWVVPLWDIPDEIGHFAYARDIGSGKGLLPLGRAEIGEDIRFDLYKRSSPPRLNWIVQHPPLYYAMAGMAWKAATYLTDDPQWLFRAPRIASALFGALTLLYVFKIIEVFGLGRKVAFAVAAGMSAIPMFSWISAGTNNDTMVAFLGTASVYYFVRFFQIPSSRDACLSLFLMLLAAATKMTALVVLAPMWLLFVLNLKKDRILQLIRNTILLTVSAWLVPGVWLVRNVFQYGNAFANASLIQRPPLQDAPLQTSLLYYLESQPVVELFFVSFFGHIGGIGKGEGSSRMFLIQTPFLLVYELLVLATVVGAVFWLCKTFFQRIKCEGGRNFFWPQAGCRILNQLKAGFLVTLILFALICGVKSSSITSTNFSSPLLIPIFGLLSFLFVAAVAVFSFRLEGKKQAILYAVLMLAFFSLVLILQVYKSYLFNGELRATQGRYFYPFIGLIVSGILVPALIACGKYVERVTMFGAVSICFTEAGFYFSRVLPYAFG